MNNPAAVMRDITGETAMQYADDMRQKNIAVSTHNRKLKRIRRVFTVLKEYYTGDNPFQSPVLYRKEREEREQDVHRLSFTREQEQQLRDVLADDQYKVMNKPVYVSITSKSTSLPGIPSFFFASSIISRIF